MNSCVLLIILILIICLALFVFCNNSWNLFGGYRTNKLSIKSASGRDLYSAIDMRHDRPVCTEMPTLPPISTRDIYGYLLNKIGIHNAAHLGTGSIGLVYLCDSSVPVKNTTNRRICVKITKSENEKTTYDNILGVLLAEKAKMPGAVDNEIERVANDYRICAVYDTQSYTLSNSSLSLTYYMILMQNMCGRSLNDMIRRPLPLEKLKIVMFNLICGVYALHEVFHIIHRDLKPDNIMYTEPIDPDNLITYSNLRIIDWGFATHLGDHTTIETNNLRGTPIYLSPEHIIASFVEFKDVFMIGYKDDIFALGSILYALATGNDGGFYGSDVETAQHLIDRARIAIRYPVQTKQMVHNDMMHAYNNRDLSNLVTSALEIDVSRRATIKDLINNPIFDTVPRECIPNFLYHRSEYIRRLDINAEETNRFIMENREIDPPSSEEEEENSSPDFVD